MTLTPLELARARAELAAAAAKGLVQVDQPPVSLWKSDRREWKRQYNRAYQRKVREAAYARLAARGIPKGFVWGEPWASMTRAERHKLGMQRLRAEARGLPTDQFPPRIRGVRTR